MTLKIEPPLNPPENKEATEICEYIDDLDLNQLANHIKGRQVEERIRQLIFHRNFTVASTQWMLNFAAQMVDTHDMSKLFEYCAPKTIEEIKEYLADYEIHLPRQEPEHDQDR